MLRVPRYLPLSTDQANLRHVHLHSLTSAHVMPVAFMIQAVREISTHLLVDGTVAMLQCLPCRLVP